MKSLKGKLWWIIIGEAADESIQYNIYCLSSDVLGSYDIHPIQRIILLKLDDESS